MIQMKSWQILGLWLLVTALIWTFVPSTEAQQPIRPFNVYQTEGACVYVIGTTEPAIAVLSKYSAGANC